MIHVLHRLEAHAAGRIVRERGGGGGAVMLVNETPGEHQHCYTIVPELLAVNGHPYYLSRAFTHHPFNCTTALNHAECDHIHTVVSKQQPQSYTREGRILDLRFGFCKQTTLKQKFG